RRRRLLALFELRRERSDRRCVEGGAYLAGVAELVALVGAAQQRGKAAARTLRIGEAADHHLLALHALHLHPVARPPTARIRRVRALRDRAFEAERAGLAKELLAAALDREARLHRADAAADDRFQHV